MPNTCALSLVCDSFHPCPVPEARPLQYEKYRDVPQGNQGDLGKGVVKKITTKTHIRSGRTFSKK